MHFMPLTTKAVLIGFVTASVAGAILTKRAGNRRIRLISLSIMLMTCCEFCSIGLPHMGWQSTDLAHSIEVLQLTASALSLAFIHLLNRENQHRLNSDIRLRVFESEVSLDYKQIGHGTVGAIKFEQPATLQVLGPHGLVDLPVQSIDLSKFGARITCPQPIGSNAPINFDLCGAPLIGRVAFCKPDREGFVIGVSFDTCLSQEKLISMLDSHRAYMRNHCNAASM